MYIEDKSQLIEKYKSKVTFSHHIKQHILIALESVYITIALGNRFTKANYSKTRLKRPLKFDKKKGLNDKWMFNEGQMYCRMLPSEHSAILLTSMGSFCNTFDLH